MYICIDGVFSFSCLPNKGAPALVVSPTSPYRLQEAAADAVRLYTYICVYIYIYIYMYIYIYIYIYI